MGSDLVQLECLNAHEGCKYKTKPKLPFEQAQKMLDTHMTRKHPDDPTSNPQRNPMMKIQNEQDNNVSQRRKSPIGIVHPTQKSHPYQCQNSLTTRRTTRSMSRSPQSSRRNFPIPPLEGAVGGISGYVKLSGMVWEATEEDVRNLLCDCNVTQVLFIMNDQGKPTGDALVKLADVADVEKAKSHNKENIGRRYVIIQESYESEFIQLSNLGRFHPF